jgi:ATP-dependent DNA helicase RecG
MLSLADPLDSAIGAGDAAALKGAFGIDTVEGLLRHYPQRYASQGKDLGEQDQEEG